MPKFERLIQAEPPLYLGAAAVYAGSKRLKRRFTFVDRFDEPYALWESGPGTHIKLPRAVCPVPGDDRRIAGPAIDVAHAFKPRNEEQKRVVSEAMGLLWHGESFVLQASTGFGKTVVCMPLISVIGRKTLVIVPKTDLMKQWREELAKFLPGVSVGTIWQNKYDVKDRDVVLAMLHSIAKPGRYPESMQQEFGFVIWDEVHRIPASSFAPSAMMFPALLRLGLSATPERRDGRDILIQANIGLVAVETAMKAMPPKVAIYDSPWRCPRTRTGELVPHSIGKMGHIMRHMSRCRPRNELITRIVAAGYKKGRNTVVFSDRVDHLGTLRGMAVKAGVPVHDTTLYVSTAPKAEKDKAPIRRVIFATYGMMGEATNIPWLDLGIMATPRADITQPLGRILRPLDDKPQPVWIDFWDDESEVLLLYLEKRLRQYREEQADVVRYMRRH